MSDETLSREPLESLAKMHIADPQSQSAFEELFRRLRMLAYWRVRAKTTSSGQGRRLRCGSGSLQTYCRENR